MNIAHLLPSSAVFPLKRHNGRYEWALRLARLQSAAGHTVTIYAGEGSVDPLSDLAWRSYTGDPTDERMANNGKLIGLAFSNDTHDIFHSHFDYLAFQLASQTSQPVITTQHWFPTEKIAEEIRNYTTPNAVAVPVTHLMRDEDVRLGIPTADVIYHGIDLALFQPQSQTHTDRFLFVGRITPTKGVLETVLFAKRAGIKLDIVGKINDADIPYWQSITSHVDGSTIRYLGPKAHEEVALIMASAKAMIFTPQVPEAFGQTIIEAQACGTPVIINNVGANRELVKDGLTGFIFRSEAELATAINDIESIDRAACTTWAQSFDIHTMAAEYEKLYRSMLHGLTA